MTLIRYAAVAIFLCFIPHLSAHAAQPQVQSIDKNRFTFSLDGSRINIEIPDPILLKKKDILLDWVVYSAATVQQYYGRFPVRTTDITLSMAGGDTVRSGRAFGGERPYLHIGVGQHVTADALSRDWIMVHEMVHLALASIPRKHRWLSEGLSTYVESIARAHRQHLTEDSIWRSFMRSMPQGLPQSGDRGLDRTPTWGRTYWGGALFCMLADIEIRQLTNNQKSLREALRGVLAGELSMHANASAMEILEAGDRAAGVDVLVRLYQKMKHDPYPVDLDQLWSELGISLIGGNIVYDDDAPMAHIRKRLLKS